MINGRLRNFHARRKEEVPLALDEGTDLTTGDHDIISHRDLPLYPGQRSSTISLLRPCRLTLPRSLSSSLSHWFLPEGLHHPLPRSRPVLVLSIPRREYLRYHLKHYYSPGTKRPWWWRTRQRGLMMDRRRRIKEGVNTGLLFLFCVCSFPHRSHDRQHLHLLREDKKKERWTDDYYHLII